MMKALTGSSSLKVVCLEKERWKLFCSQRPEICFLGLPSGRHNGKFSLLSSVERKNIRPIFAASSALSSSASNSQTQFQSEELESTDEFKTACVKFQLQRQCSFGQQFLIVGDDPILGSWDPSNAVPLTWSDGHVWTVEMDIPCGKSLSYKFILKGAANTILWQPGPDRILDVWETSNVITVSEDWDNIDLQKIMEEELLTGEPEESPSNSEVLRLTGEPEESPINSEVLSAENLTPERIDSDANANDPVRIVAENITGAEEDVNASDASGSKDGINVEETVTTGQIDFGKNGTATHGGNLSSKDETGLTFDEGVPVLVPGLHQVLSVETEAMPSNEIQVETVAESSLRSSEAEEFKLQEHLELNSKEEFQTDSSNDKETSEVMFTNINGIVDNGHVQEPELEELQADNGHIQEPELEELQEYQHDTQQLDPRVIKSDHQWGRQTIKKFLTNLGWL